MRTNFSGLRRDPACYSVWFGCAGEDLVRVYAVVVYIDPGGEVVDYWDCHPCLK